MKEKTPLSHEVVCVQMLDFETSNSKPEVSKSNSCKITSFSKTTPLQREPFFKLFYTTNLSPLLVTKQGYVLIIILSNYQQCPLPLKAPDNLSQTNILTRFTLNEYPSQRYASNITSVKIWAQLVIKVAHNLLRTIILCAFGCLKRSLNI